MNKNIERVANAINKLYEIQDSRAVTTADIDNLRDEAANALGLEGLCGSSEFITLANTIKKPQG